MNAPCRSRKQALCLLGSFLSVLTACSKPQNPSRLALEESQILRTETLAKGTYSSCQELQASVRRQLRAKRTSDAAEQKYWQEYWDKHGGEPIFEEVQAPAEEEADAESGADPNAITNVQEAGVDEEDFVKVDAHHLYVLRQNRLEVLDRHTLASRGTLVLENEFPAEVFQVQALTSLKMYADSGLLMIIGQFRQEDYQLERRPYQPWIPQGHPMVKIIFLKTQGKGLPTKFKEEVVSGEYHDSRLTQHHLYLIVKDQLPLLPLASGQPIPDQPVLAIEGTVQGIPCSHIARQKAPDLDFALTKAISIDLEHPDKTPYVMGMIGGGEQIYMSKKNIYITKSGYAWKPWVRPGSRESASIFQKLEDTLLISKFSLQPEEGLIRLEADGLVKGFVRNQFFFKEYGEQGVLAVATTSFRSTIDTMEWNGSVLGEGLNHLWILSQEGDDLKLVNGLYHFGKPGEDLRSVRFSGNYAYMVTFKKTDPLFAFDMTNPREPRLVGELFVPGFSMYLHPVADQRLVGVGYDADDQGDFAWYQGVQISLFDAKSPHELTRLDNHIHGQRGSYSDVTGQHHAFSYDASTQTFTVPIVELVGKDQDLGPEYGTKLQFSGAVVYRIDGNKLLELGRVSHRNLMPPSCLPYLNDGQWWEHKVSSLDVNRLFKLDGRWVSISRFGVKEHDGDFGVIKSVAFDRSLSACG